MYVIYAIAQNVIFAGLFSKSYPQALATEYLMDLKKEFFFKFEERKINGASVAYAFMDFEPFIEKTKREYEQSKTTRNLSQVQGNLTDIHKVMTKSLSEVVNRGEDINALGDKSDLVLAESESYRKASVDLNRMKWIQKYGVIVVILCAIGLVVYLRKKVFVYN
jgi:vesicle transport protein SEC22